MTDEDTPREKTSLFTWNRYSFRTRLIVSFLMVVLLVGGMALAIGMRTILTRVYAQAQDAVLGNLNAARSLLESDLDSMKLQANALSVRNELDIGMDSCPCREMENIFDRMVKEGSIDMITLVGSDGIVRYRYHNRGASGDSLAGDSLIREVLASGRTSASPQLFSAERMQREGEDLAGQAAIELKPTPMARDIDYRVERRGLVLGAAAPVFRDDRLVGVVYIGRLLNNDFEFVDRIRSIVFSGGKTYEPRQGNATIFLEDVRVSTNVMTREGKRAVGTRVSRQVYDTVYEKGESWIDRAFVVNDWYITAYRPIRDSNRKIIGILYVGLLESVYDRVRNRTILLFVLVIASSILLSLALALFLIRGINRPVRQLSSAAYSIAGGHYRKVPDIQGSLEMDKLAMTFNRMVDAIRERDRILREHTEKQIFQMQKLASLGRLSAGIAHEMNNPLTGILTYSSLLLEKLENTEHGEDLQVIVRETRRCMSIVQEILNFSRDSKLEKEEADLNMVIDENLRLLEGNRQFDSIQFKRSFDPDLPSLMIDVNQFKSVISNLVTNAVDAMPEGGDISISTRYDRERDEVELRVSDRGVGIPENDLEQIFDPFFTTKEVGRGTGLGLAVTWGVVKNHNGEINVESSHDSGTTVTIRIPRLEEEKDS
jgi:two-component system NtrC family sensor kinase